MVPRHLPCTRLRLTLIDIPFFSLKKGILSFDCLRSKAEVDLTLQTTQVKSSLRIECVKSVRNPVVSFFTTVKNLITVGLPNKM